MPHEDADRYLPLEPHPEVVAFLALGFIRPGDRVLDIGCFQGDDAVYLQSAGCKAKGIDTSPTAIAYARGLAKTMCQDRKRPVFIVGSAVPTLKGMREESVDVVLDRLCMSNLNVSEQRAYLRQVRRVLVPGGFFFLRVGMAEDGPVDGETEPPEEIDRVLAAGFSRVSWSRSSVTEKARTTRGQQLFLSPTRAGFHNEAWLEVFEKAERRR